MLSIFEGVEEYQAGRVYNVYDIYKYQGLYYYATQKHSAGTIFDPQFSNGVIQHNGVNRQYFFFKPSYNSNIEVRPTIKKAQFSDGYTQRTIDGINNVLLPFDLVFDKRTDAEARAILHFLERTKGMSFVYTPPFPWNINKIFCCELFRHSQIFANNHSISAQFLETPV